jgi:hypothetical protein
VSEEIPRMKQRKYSPFRFGFALGTGALIASVLCIQCVRTYLYTDDVLVPQQAEREAERQVGALTTAARSAGITDPRALGPAIEHVLESSSDRVLWIRLLDPESKLLVQGGKPEGTAKIPSQWWKRVETHESLGPVVDTVQGKALVAMLPFRLPRPSHQIDAARPERSGSGVSFAGHRPPACVIEVAIPLKAVVRTLEGLRHNLVVGLIASIALLLSLATIALRARQCLRGKYLESELQLVRRVQSDLQPDPHSVSPVLDFAASAIAADHVGGDFYDIFEAEPGKFGIVLGDVSGKGIPAALLVSVRQGAIRSSMTSGHESACERINRMLCERTACERFATLFWGVFDPVTRTLRHVNAGHAAPDPDPAAPTRHSASGRRRPCSRLACQRTLFSRNSRDRQLRHARSLLGRDQRGDGRGRTGVWRKPHSGVTLGQDGWDSSRALRTDHAPGYQVCKCRSPIRRPHVAGR